VAAEVTEQNIIFNEPPVLKNPKRNEEEWHHLTDSHGKKGGKRRPHGASEVFKPEQA